MNSLVCFSRWLLALSVVVLNLALPGAGCAGGLPAKVESMLEGNDAIVVTGLTAGSSPTVRLGRRFGGAIVSVQYRGTEYVNNTNVKNQVDFGRQWQSAVQYRGLNECFNPTEAGGRYDLNQPRSSSQLLSITRPVPNAVLTRSDMAFWMAPGDTLTDDPRCVAANSDVRGGYLLDRTIEVGYGGSPNVIFYKVQFNAPVPEPKPRYEVVSIHTPPAFNHIFKVDAEGVPEEVIAPRQRGKLPFMLTTDSRMDAVLVCSTSLDGRGFYGVVKWPGVVTLRFVYPSEGPEKESSIFSNFLIVGTAAEVIEAARQFCF